MKHHEPSRLGEPADTSVHAKQSMGVRDTAAADQAVAKIGAKIRTLRSRRGLTLKDLGSQTGLSVSMLSMLERGVASASVGTLVSVASALGVHMYDLFDRPESQKGSPITRRADQAVAITNNGATRRVAHYDTAAGVELAVNTYAVGSASAPNAVHHHGSEFGVVLSGRLQIELDGEVHTLEPGDAVAYSSVRPHRISNAGEQECIAVWVNVDPA